MSYHTEGLTYQLFIKLSVTDIFQETNYLQALISGRVQKSVFCTPTLGSVRTYM